MAASTTSTNWVSYYRANRGDGGTTTIEALYTLADIELADITKRHNNNSGPLRTTIASSGGANFLLVPGPKGIVKFQHHGFSTTMILCFIQGSNLLP